MIGRTNIPDFVLLQSALPPRKELRLPTDRIADVVPIKDAGIALVQMQGRFEPPGHVATLESALRAWPHLVSRHWSQRVVSGAVSMGVEATTCAGRSRPDAGPRFIASAGELDVAALEHMIDRRVKLTVITHGRPDGGLAYPHPEEH